MPPKTSRKAVTEITPDPDTPLVVTPTVPVGTDSEGLKDETELPSTKDATVAGSSGLSAESKAEVPAFGDELQDDSDDELDIDFKTDELCNLRHTAILLIPFMLAQELASVVSTVKVLMKRVWCNVLSADAADSAKFQILQPAYIAKIRFCRLQVSFLLEGDAHGVRQFEVDYQRVNGKLVRLCWQHTDNLAFVRERSTNPLAVEVVLRNVSASVTPEALQRMLVHYKLKSTASVKLNQLTLPILRDPAIALISTGGQREEWLCTQMGCKKAHGASFMEALDHVRSANHLSHLEKLGTATRLTLEKASLSVILKDYGFQNSSGSVASQQQRR
ncbi:unnamed protein product [Closterium sp. Naga37s-1]|nr:unnamed protein product [Closterium sp. Naga37s-1]